MTNCEEVTEGTEFSVKVVVTLSSHWQSQAMEPDSKPGNLFLSQEATELMQGDDSHRAIDQVSRLA